MGALTSLEGAPILTRRARADLGIEHDASIGKDELRELVLQEDALTKWEKKHPGQKKVRAYYFAIAWPPHVHRMCTAWPPHVHTACAHCMCTAHALHVRRPVHCMCMYMCMLDARGAHSAMHTRCIHCMHTAGAQQGSRRLGRRRRRRCDGRHVLYDDGQGQGRYAGK